MKDIRRTKIVATLGPASWTEERFEELVQAGLDVVRLNFSHVDYDRFRVLIELTRKLAKKYDRPIGIIGDLQGPKIRTGRLKGGKPIMLMEGEELTITTDDVEGTPEKISTTYPDLARDVEPGQEILLSDGVRVLEVLDKTDTEIRCRVVIGGELAEHQGINLPGSIVSAPSLTKKDEADLQFCLDHDVDYIALSFVRKPQDLITLKEKIKESGKKIPVLSKIEKPEALRNIQGILRETDAVMVARGDLGVEMKPEAVPLEQKRLIAQCNARGKPVITATQMLESMIHSPRPTRAEASDVANAIFDGTDAVMLSGETAVGKYPVRAVETMARIAVAVEQESCRECSRRSQALQGWSNYHDLDVGDIAEMTESTIDMAAADAAVSAAWEIKAAGIIVFTLSGSTAMKIAKRRPHSPIFALTPKTETYGALSLVWGVVPFLTPFGDQTDQIISTGERLLLQGSRLSKGDMVVIVSGEMPAPGATNFVKIERIGETTQHWNL